MFGKKAARIGFLEGKLEALQALVESEKASADKLQTINNQLLATVDALQDTVVRMAAPEVYRDRRTEEILGSTGKYNDLIKKELDTQTILKEYQALMERDQVLEMSDLETMLTSAQGPISPPKTIDQEY